MGKYSPKACGYLRVKPWEKSIATVMVVGEWPCPKEGSSPKAASDPQSPLVGRFHIFFLFYFFLL
jgi:hypothetical protein